jgi:hypothetical protein
MKNGLTTRTWQDNIWCPINIILLCTSDVSELKALKDKLLGVDGFNHVMMLVSSTSVYCIGETAYMDSFMVEFDCREGESVFNVEFINKGDGHWFKSLNNWEPIRGRVIRTREVFIFALNGKELRYK